MVQTTDHYDKWSDKRFETEESLKRYLAAHYQNVNTREFSLGQTSTAAFVELFEDSGETVSFPTENKTIVLWQKTDQVATDGGKQITIEYVTVAGAVKSVSVDLNAVATNTEVATGITDFYRLRKLTSDEVLVADEVLIGLTGKGTVYGVIKVGCWEGAHSRYYTPAGYRAFLVHVTALGPHTNPSTYQITLVPKGKTLAEVWNKGNILSSAYDEQDFLWEIEPLYDLKFEVKKDADANHGTFVLRYKLVEAY